MSNRTRDHLERAKNLLKGSIQKAEAGSFAHELEAISLRSHIDELETYEAIEAVGQSHELVDFRMIADTFQAGSVPLNILSKASEEIRKMLGYAALRFIQGGIDRKRVPKELYRELDLRLAGVLPGSSRLLIAAAAHRDLFDDGVAKHAIQRIMDVLETGGKGKQFLNSVADLGPSSAKSLREFLRIIRANSGALELTWSHAGSDVQKWIADAQAISDVTAALEHTVLKEHERQILKGKIELLSKRERIQLRTDTGEIIRILFPKRLLPDVTELHLDQDVSLLCQVTVSENPLTNEYSHHHELIEVRG
jgi:hypothetical protein